MCSTGIVTMDELVSCVCATHPLARKRAIDVDDFVRYPHVVVAVPGSGRSMIDRALDKLGKRRTLRASTGHFLISPFVPRRVAPQ